eukprot:m.139190 g.139190  ORF g.139190 m.139190 type:complete len:1037 (-) comp16083_c2_seq27:1809-4919(-)
MDETTVYRVDVQQLQLEDNLATSTNTAIFKGYALNDASENVTTPNYVAIKLLRSSVPSRFQTTPRRTVSDSVNKPSEDGAAPFQAELDCLLQLQHTHIVQTLGIVHTKHQDVGLLFELCAGGSIASLLQHNDTAVTHAHKLRWAIQAANALSYVHDQGWIHRDVAARNLLLSQDLTTCKLADFGMARQLPPGQSKLKLAGDVIIVRYSSPEVLQTRTFSAQSDTYAFGLFLLELFLDGRMPFPNWDIPKVWLAVVNGLHHPKPKDMPEELYTVARACWCTPSTPSMATVAEALSLSIDMHRFNATTCNAMYRRLSTDEEHVLPTSVVTLYATSAATRRDVIQQVADKDTQSALIMERHINRTRCAALSMNTTSGEWSLTKGQPWLVHARLQALHAEQAAASRHDSSGQTTAGLSARLSQGTTAQDAWHTVMATWVESSRHLLSLLGNPSVPEYRADRVFSTADVGLRVQVAHGFGLATVQYVGLYGPKAELRLGLALDEAKGKHNGTVAGRSYFVCKPNHGLMAAPEHVTRLDQDSFHASPLRPIDSGLASRASCVSLDGPVPLVMSKLTMRTAKRHAKEATMAANSLRLTLWDINASTCQLPAWQRQALQPSSCSLNIVTFDASRLLDASTQLDEQSKLFPMLDTALLFNQAPILLVVSNTVQSSESALEACLQAYPNFACVQERLWLPSSGLCHVSSDPSFRQTVAQAAQSKLLSTRLSAPELALLDPLLCQLHVGSKGKLGLPLADCQEAVAKAGLKSPRTAVAAAQKALSATCLGMFYNSPTTGTTAPLLMRPSDLEDLFVLLNELELDALILPRKHAKQWRTKRQVSLAILQYYCPLQEDEGHDDVIDWDQALECLEYLKLATLVNRKRGVLQLLPPLVSHPSSKLAKNKRATHLTWYPHMGRGHTVAGPLLQDLLTLLAVVLLRNGQAACSKDLKWQSKRWRWRQQESSVIEVQLPFQDGAVHLTLGQTGVDVMLAGKHLQSDMVATRLSTALAALGCEILLKEEQGVAAFVRTTPSAWELKAITDEAVV